MKLLLSMCILVAAIGVFSVLLTWSDPENVEAARPSAIITANVLTDSGGCRPTSVITWDGDAFAHRRGKLTVTFIEHGGPPGGPSVTLNIPRGRPSDIAIIGAGLTPGKTYHTVASLNWLKGKKGTVTGKLVHSLRSDVDVTCAA